MIDEIINQKQFESLQKDKEKKLLDILKLQIDENNKNENLKVMYKTSS